MNRRKRYNLSLNSCQHAKLTKFVGKQILEYVESRISLLAPNISAIVGTQTATKILGIAGGLQGPNRIPHSNIYVRLPKLYQSHSFSKPDWIGGRNLRRFSERWNVLRQDSPRPRIRWTDSTPGSSTTVLSSNPPDPKIEWKHNEKLVRKSL